MASKPKFDADATKRRIGAKTHAKELIAFIDSEVAMEQTTELRWILLDALAVRFGKNTREVVAEEPMSDAGSIVFERQLMLFGKHVGKRIKDMPMDYLLWLECEPDFRRKLRRYLHSERIQREQVSP